MAKTSPILQWFTLVLSTLGLSIVLQPLISAASILVAAMACGMSAGFFGVQFRIEPIFTALAQGVTGAAIASTLDLSELLRAASDGLVVLGVVLTVGSAVVVGWVLVRFSPLPGTTGAWGSMPGGASIMGALATENGGDGILVFLMQYLRVVLVVITGPLVSHLLATPVATAASASATASNTGTHIFQLSTLIALSIAAVGCWVGTRFRILAGSFLVPLVIGAVWVTTIPTPMAVPPPILKCCFAILGWTIGLQFRRDLLAPLIRSLPTMLAAITAMIALRAISAWAISAGSAVSFLTAYLATSPGGMDSIVAIAFGTPVDMNFIVATQTLRLFSVVLCGPWIAKRIAR
ncbi:AbrB family transcriptional regulator [Cupriavidus metallidurans]|uniref:AbrB family transcriptional regulator n=1 Tax=Cupriavidus metallidurans TaxID=119219 RepID=UPI0009B92A47|nr:AbrB family transcriptional regulator [Cupriavidus metallidurans]